jgi:hypothetical protein
MEPQNMAVDGDRERVEREAAERFARLLVAEWWHRLKHVPMRSGCKIILNIDPGHDTGTIEWPNPKTSVSK